MYAIYRGVSIAALVELVELVVNNLVELVVNILVIQAPWDWVPKFV